MKYYFLYFSFFCPKMPYFKLFLLIFTYFYLKVKSTKNTKNSKNIHFINGIFMLNYSVLASVLGVLAQIPFTSDPVLGEQPPRTPRTVYLTESLNKYFLKSTLPTWYE